MFSDLFESLFLLFSDGLKPQKLYLNVQCTFLGFWCTLFESGRLYILWCISTFGGGIIVYSSKTVNHPQEVWNHNLMTNRGKVQGLDMSEVQEKQSPIILMQFACCNSQSEINMQNFTFLKLNLNISYQASSCGREEAKTPKKIQYCLPRISKEGHIATLQKSCAWFADFKIHAIRKDLFNLKSHKKAFIWEWRSEVSISLIFTGFCVCEGESKSILFCLINWLTRLDQKLLMLGCLEKWLKE